MGQATSENRYASHHRFSAAESVGNNDIVIALLEGAPDGIVVTDEKTNILFTNERVESLFGYDQKALLGKPISYLIPDRFHDNHALHSSAFFENPKARPMGHSLNLYGMRKSGEEFPVEVSLSCVDTEIGLLAISFIVDISVRKKAQDKLNHQYLVAENAQSQTRAILNATNDAIVLISGTGEVLSVNRVFYDMFFGERKEQVVGRQFKEFETYLDDIFLEPDTLRTLINNTSADPELVFEQIIPQKSPIERQLKISSTPVRTESGDHMGRLYVFRDVTFEREIDRMKTEFVSVVSHELRTPLTTIKGFTDLVLNEEAGDINEEQHEFLSIVKRDTNRLIALVNDLLDISHIESGKIGLILEQIILGEIVQEVAKIFDPQIREKQLDIAIRIDPMVPYLLGDRDRLIQIVTNLLSNAIKYTPESGEIIIEVKKEKNWANLIISDNGIGITESNQQKLFTRFFRVDSSLTRAIGGTGLGLAIVKSLVEMHEGTVSVSSQLGAGSSFSVKLPLPVEPDRQIPDASEAGIQGEELGTRGRSILVVEDKPVIAQLITRHLNQAGYLVETVENEERALEVIGDRLPDLVTLNINLRRMTGLSMAEKLNRSPESQNIPILVYSVELGESQEIRFLLVESLPQPIDHEQLISAVQQVLEHSHRERVLIVEDDPGVRQYLGTTLRKRGFEVVEAQDGEIGLDLAKRVSPGLILLDLRLPKMDGVAVLRALKKDPITAELPVIVITGSEGFKLGARAKVLALGATDFLTKPFDINTLLREIQVLTGGE